MKFLITLTVALSFYNTTLFAADEASESDSKIITLSLEGEERIKMISPLIASMAGKVYANKSGRIKTKWGYRGTKNDLYDYMDEMLEKTHENDMALYLGLAVGQFLKSPEGRRLLKSDKLLLKFEKDLEEIYSDAVDTTMFQKMTTSALYLGGAGATVGFFAGGAFVSAGVIGGLGLVAGAIIAIPYDAVKDLIQSGSETLDLLKVKEIILNTDTPTEMILD